jgi:hypothetical protein
VLAEINTNFCKERGIKYFLQQTSNQTSFTKQTSSGATTAAAAA